MNRPDVRVGGSDCRVFVNWTLPNGVNQNQVERYIVKAMNQRIAGTYKEIVDCRTVGNSLSCSTPMSTFTNKSPFQLVMGDALSIVVAVKLIGVNEFSNDSPVNTDEVVRSCTQPVARITNLRSNTGCTSLNASWSIATATSSG